MKPNKYLVAYGICMLICYGSLGYMILAKVQLPLQTMYIYGYSLIFIGCVAFVSIFMYEKATARKEVKK